MSHPHPPAAPGHASGQDQDDAAASGAPGPAQPYPKPVPVQVEHAGAEPVSPRASDYGAWFTYVLAATTPAQKIAPHDEQRARMLVIVSGTGPVLVGSQGQAQASPPLGGTLATGATYELRNKQELWLAPDGTHTATVTTLIERYDGTC